MSDNTIIIDLAARYAAAFGMTAVSARSHAVIEQREDHYSLPAYPMNNNAFEEITLYFNDGQPLHFKESFSLNTGAVQQGEFSTIYAPPLLIDFSREKQLVETQISGGDSLVIERWGIKPWQLTMRGLLIDLSERIYPRNKIHRLHQIFENSKVIEVSGVQMEDKEIDSIYLKSVSITALEGFEDTIQFSIEASAIKKVGFTLLNPSS